MQPRARRSSVPPASVLLIALAPEPREHSLGVQLRYRGRELPTQMLRRLAHHLAMILGMVLGAERVILAVRADAAVLEDPGHEDAGSHEDASDPDEGDNEEPDKHPMATNPISMWYRRMETYLYCPQFGRFVLLLFIRYLVVFDFW
jgi:hypothetical protein